MDGSLCSAIPATCLSATTRPTGGPNASRRGFPRRPFPTTSPLTQALALLLSREMAGKIAVLNPFGAHHCAEQARPGPDVGGAKAFLAKGQAAIERYLPPSFRLETQSLPSLRKSAKPGC